jgi:hypothetical protein
MKIIMRYWDGIFFGVFWTLGMLWWNWPLEVAPTIILVVCGAVAGVLFHLIMGWWMRRMGMRPAGS